MVIYYGETAFNSFVLLFVRKVLRKVLKRFNFTGDISLIFLEKLYDIIFLFNSIRGKYFEFNI